MPDIMHLIRIHAPPKRVYQAITTVEGILGFAPAPRSCGRSTPFDSSPDFVIASNLEPMMIGKRSWWLGRAFGF
jgi:hypothetical protein